MDKTFDPQKFENSWYEYWEKQGFFKPSGKGNPYCIMIPPPNVTGHLHMGHAFQQTLMDILIRYHRMQGNNTLWQVGTDHAGIATQMVVERQLEQQGLKRTTLGREEFVARVWQWKEQSGGNITRQLRRLGASVDWEHERFTLDPGLSQAVQEVFLKLYEEGLIYRGKRLVNWDPVLHTAVSDLEVENEEEPGKLWYIRYPLETPTKNREYVVIATTRPETLLGDVAVAVHPDDERYRELIGKQLILPLCNRHIPIIADAEVLPEFGTGAVKITPGHDFNDNAIGKRHKLPELNILTLDAKINEVAPKAFEGLDRFVAREKIIQALQEIGLIEKIEDYVVKIPRGDRSGAILEPMLTDQWFVKIESLAKPAIEAVEKEHIKFIPDNWKKTYFEWMNNIQDWCISRQLWWGHRIPAWYDNQDNIYVGRSEAEIRKKHHLADNVPLTQDEDVLDTWFSSALWPFSTLGWPEKTEYFKTFYPTTVLITGFDIIFFWVARMIMFGLKFTDHIPFHEVYIHGLILDQDGQKMSKTKGNVLDPLDLIDGIDLDTLVKKRTSGMMQPQLADKIAKQTRSQYPDGIPAFGTDALRFTFSAIATGARHIRFDLNRIEGYRHFCNKLWNAARFVLMNTEEFTTEGLNDTTLDFTLPDQWIRSRLQKTKEAIGTHLKAYRFDLAAQAIYEFTWNEYCDWYLELAKPVLMAKPQDLANKQTQATRYTLITVLEELLRLNHPFMPFITEEIWQTVKQKMNITADTIMLQAYPKPHPKLVHEEIEEALKWLQEVIVSIRNVRGEMNISPGKFLSVIVYEASDSDKIRLEKYQPWLTTLAKINSLSFKQKEKMANTLSATVRIGSLEFCLPLEGLIDVKAEITRLEKELQKIGKDLNIVTARLNNANFVEKAPEEVVRQERKLKETLEAKQQTISKALEQIKSAPAKIEVSP